jgi:hypothetical protein
MTVPLLHQLIAEQMRHELASRRLEVVLVPSPVEFWPTQQQRRVVCERNPAWYRELCRQYPSSRSRPRRRAKPDTAIKRAHTLRALAEIQDGRVESEYAQRVYPFVIKAAAEYEATFARKRQPARKEHRHEHIQPT